MNSHTRDNKKSHIPGRQKKTEPLFLIQFVNYLWCDRYKNFTGCHIYNWKLVLAVIWELEKIVIGKIRDVKFTGF